MYNILIFLSLFLLAPSYTTETERPFEQKDFVFKTKKAFNHFIKNWTPQKKRISAKQIGLYPFKLVFNVVKFPFTSSETSQRVSHLGEAGYFLVQGATQKDKEKLKQAGYKILDGPTNILGVADGLISDSAGLLSLFKNSLYPYTDRIKLCSLNILNLFTDKMPLLSHLGMPINPIKHIGYVVDQNWETQDPYGAGLVDSKDTTGSLCAPVPLLKNESPSLAIERLSCINDEFYPDYDFINFNCGGYTRKIGKYAGIGYEKFNNLGIGTFSPLPYQKKTANKNEMRSATESCEHKIKNRLISLYNLARGEEIKQEAFADLFYFSSMDLRLQTVFLLARNNQDHSKRRSMFEFKEKYSYYIGKMLNYYLKSKKNKRVIRNKALKRFIHKINQDLDASAKNWLLHLDPDFTYLI